MATISVEDQKHYMKVVAQWNDLPPGDLDFDHMPEELRAEWIARAPIVASLLKENGGPFSERTVLEFLVNDVFVPLAHGLDHNPSVTPE